MPLLSEPEAWTIGKRIQNIIGASGTIGAKLLKECTQPSRPCCKGARVRLVHRRSAGGHKRRAAGVSGISLGKCLQG